MRTSRKTFALLVASVFAIVLLPATALAQMTAKIVRITGNPQQATITSPTGASSPAAVNLPVVEGSTIETRAGVDLYVETFPGAVATIRQNSLVKLSGLRLLSAGADAGKRQAELDLQRGKIISTLDPTKQAITKYGIKTPRGVAAARGTVYGVSAVAAGTSAFVVDGNIVIDLGPGQPPISIPYGQAALDNAGSAAALAALVSGSPELAADLLAAVQIVAANVAANTSAVGGPDVATAMLQAVTTAVVTALPGQAGAVVQTLVSAIVTPGSATSGSQQTMLNAITAVTGAAAQAVAAAGGTLTQSAAAAQGAAQAVAQIAPGGAGSGTVVGFLSAIGDVVAAAAIQGTGGNSAGVITTTIANAVTAGAATGSGTPPVVSIVATPNAGTGTIVVTTTVTAGNAGTGNNASSSTTISNAGLGSVTTQINTPGGSSTLTSTPPAGTPPRPGQNTVSQPAQTTITPFAPIDPSANVSPSGL
ncbi:MAG: FecR domain-containing protein [Opitutaceae bacterium]|nr:FecR domain-containing protein [Opitutaceae bacterium]